MFHSSTLVTEKHELTLGAASIPRLPCAEASTDQASCHWPDLVSDMTWHGYGSRPWHPSDHRNGQTTMCWLILTHIHRSSQITSSQSLEEFANQYGRHFISDSPQPLIVCLTMCQESWLVINLLWGFWIMMIITINNWECVCLHEVYLTTSARKFWTSESTRKPKTSAKKGEIVTVLYSWFMPGRKPTHLDSQPPRLIVQTEHLLCMHVCQ